MITSLSAVPFFGASFGITGCATPAAVSPELVKAFAPTGTLRASINLGNPILANRNPAMNNDPAVGDRLKVVFIPNYDVSTAGDIIPAADLSQQISTAGTEASGTGNMKLALNGALTIGTLDGANIEIREEVGEDNFFIFGLTAAEIQTWQHNGYNPWHFYNTQPELKHALDMINTGYFSPGDADRFKPIFDALTTQGDRFFLLADYASYMACQANVDALYRDPEEWTRKAILNVAHMGKFSSDRTIGEYAKNIWETSPSNPRSGAAMPR